MPALSRCQPAVLHLAEQDEAPPNQADKGTDRRGDDEYLPGQEIIPGCADAHEKAKTRMQQYGTLRALTTSKTCGAVLWKDKNNQIGLYR